MNNGWVKLHRKLLDNPELSNDNTACLLFIKLLLVTDKRTGTFTTGRFRLAELSNEKPTTVYKALKRLEKWGMIKVYSNNKRTTIHLCNFNEYQQDSNNKVTTKGQQKDNKVTLNKNKEERIKNKEVLSLDANALKVEEAMVLSIKSNYPNLKLKEPNGKWASDIEKIHRLDGYSWEDIIKTAAWSQRDNFWKQNIQSGASLRRQFSKLLVKTSTTSGGTY